MTPIAPLRTRPRQALSVLLIALGLSQAFGSLFGFSSIESFGKWSLASPLPLVFTGSGYEQFALEIEIELINKDGTANRHKLGRGDFSRIGGPFIRRGAYALAIAFAPNLPPELTRSVLRKAFCNKGPLARGLTSDAVDKVSLFLRPKGASGQTTVTFRCPKL